MEDVKGLLGDSIDNVFDYLIQTDTLTVVILNDDFTIAMHNQCFGKLVGDGKDLSGLEISSCLLPESYSIFDKPLEQNQSIWLNFKSPSSYPVPLKCRIFKLPNNKYLILGGNLMLTNEQILQEMTIMSNELANMARDLKKKNRELEDHSKIRVLSGIITICMHCKKIRDDAGYWEKLENFITNHSEAYFSHGICDECIKKYYSDSD